MLVELTGGSEVVVHEQVHEQPSEIALLAHHGGELVGMAVCDLEHPLDGHVVIAVKPEWRRLGLGRALLDRMVERARDLGLAYLILAHGTHNLAASKLVESSGLVVARRVRDEMVRAVLVVAEPSGVTEPKPAA